MRKFALGMDKNPGISTPTLRHYYYQSSEKSCLARGWAISAENSSTLP